MRMPSKALVLMHARAVAAENEVKFLRDLIEEHSLLSCRLNEWPCSTPSSPDAECAARRAKRILKEHDNEKLGQAETSASSKVAFTTSLQE